MEIKVDVSGVSLDSVIGEHRVSDGEDGYLTEPMTLRDALIEEVARQSVKRVTTEDWQPLRKLIQDVRKEMIAELLLPQLQKAMSGEVRKTNGLGEPVGPPVSMRQLILDEATKVLRAKVDKQGRYARYHGDEDTDFVTYTIREMVKEVLGAELKAELDKAKETMKAALQEFAAEKLAKSVAL